jgi:hypothetical protein
MRLIRLFQLALLALIASVLITAIGWLGDATDAFGMDSHSEPKIITIRAARMCAEDMVLVPIDQTELRTRYACIALDAFANRASIARLDKIVSAID